MGVGQSVLAEENPVTGSSRLDPIIVTATRQAEPEVDITMSVSFIDGNEISQGSTSAEDLTDLLVGVEAAVANGTQIAFQIRGIGAVDHQALTPTAAAVYADGVFLATNVQTGPLLYDIDRVEVLKGPQGTLYGRNASSGAINIQSVKPKADQDRYVRIGAGNLSRFDASAALGGQVSDATHWRLAGKYLKRDAALDNVGGPQDAGGERDEFGLRASLNHNTGAGDLLFRAHYEEDNGVNPTPRNSGLEAGDHQISSEGDGIQDTDNEFYGLSVEYNGNIGEWTFFSLSALEGYNQQYGFDFDGTPAPFGIPTLNANLSYDRDFIQLSQELRLLRETSWGDTLVGATVSAERFEQVYTIWCGELDPETLLGTCRYVGAPGRAGPDPASDGTATTLITDIAQDRTTFALFTYNNFKLAEDYELALGGRLTHEDIQGQGKGIHIFDDGVIAFNNRDGLGPAIGQNAFDNTRLSGNIAFSRAFGFGTAYASFSNSFKSGGFNGEVANNATHYSDEGLFDAETVSAFELGFKSQPTNTLRFNIAGFFQDYSDPQARIFVDFPLPDGTSITSNSLSNLDSAISAGIEADFIWTILDGLNVYGSGIWNDTEIEQVSEVGGNAELFDGNPLPFAPEFASTLGASYAFSPMDGLDATTSVNAKYRSEYYLDAEGLEERMQDEFVTLQAQIDLAWESGIQLSVWGRNLTDEDYAISGFGFIGYNTFRSDPQTYGITIGYNF